MFYTLNFKLDNRLIHTNIKANITRLIDLTQIWYVALGLEINYRL